jgi:DNA-binding CsgD family transcriptional regulator
MAVNPPGARHGVPNIAGGRLSTSGNQRAAAMNTKRSTPQFSTFRRPRVQDDQPVADPDALAAGVAAFASVHRLSPRQAQILLRLSAGTHPKQIACDAGCSYNTVRTQLARISKKLECFGTREILAKLVAGAWGRAPIRKPEE